MWLKQVNKGDNSRKRGQRNKGSGGNKGGRGLSRAL